MKKIIILIAFVFSNTAYAINCQKSFIDWRQEHPERYEAKYLSDNVIETICQTINQDIQYGGLLEESKTIVNQVTKYPELITTFLTELNVDKISYIFEMQLPAVLMEQMEMESAINTSAIIKTALINTNFKLK